MEEEQFGKVLVFGIIMMFVLASIIPQAGAENIEPRHLGAVIYVDDDAPCPGSGTLPSPYCRIQYGIENASEDNTIMVANGTYYENIIINTEGLSLEWYGTDIIGSDIGQPIIDGGGLSDVIKVFSDNVEISYFTIQNSGGLNFGVNNLATGTIVSNCDIIDNYNGVHLLRPVSNSCIIDSCTISDNVLSGILLFDRSRENTIINCEFTGNRWGIWAVESYDSYIQENYFSENKIGLVLQGANTYNVDVFRCIFEDNEVGLWLYGGANRNFIHYNDFMNTSKKYGPFSFLTGSTGDRGLWRMHAIFSMCVKQDWDHNYWSPRPFFQNSTQPYIIWGTMYPTWLSILLPGAWRPQIPWFNIDMNCRATPLNG